MTAPVAEWIPRRERRLFTAIPLRLLDLASCAEVIAGANGRRRVALIAGFAGEARIRTMTAPSSRQIRRAALGFAEATGDPVVAGVVVGLTKSMAPIFSPVLRVRVAKSNPMTPEALEAYANTIARRLGVPAAGQAERLTAEAMEYLDFNWEIAGVEQWAEAEAGIAGVLGTGLTPEQMQIQQLSLSNGLARVMRDVTGHVTSVPPLRGTTASAMDLPDRRIGQAFARHHGFWVRDHYGTISQQLAAGARPAIMQGIADGRGRVSIARDLARDMRDAMKSQAYWETVAANAVVRAREYAHGASMLQAGITAFRVEAIIDESTTETCLMLHDKLIPLAPAMALQNRILADPNPEGVLWNQPFSREDRENGLIYVQYPDERRVVIGEVVMPGYGTGDRGEYRNVLGGRELLNASVGFPPYHHRCRTTVVPEII